MTGAYYHNRQRKENQAQMRRALERAKKYCYITEREVTVCVEYPQYRGLYSRGPAGDTYCEHLVECYERKEKCRYSGISAYYPDPFVRNAFQSASASGAEDWINGEEETLLKDQKGMFRADEAG
ncbi:hypothetical protein IJT93_11655 [bacterium]|nr:hypothetical protein [bacterium]